MIYCFPRSRSLIFLLLLNKIIISQLIRLRKKLGSTFLFLVIWNFFNLEFLLIHILLLLVIIIIRINTRSNGDITHLLQMWLHLINLLLFRIFIETAHAQCEINLKAFVDEYGHHEGDHGGCGGDQGRG